MRLRSVKQLMDHVISEGIRIFADSNCAHTWMIYHDHLKIWWEKETQAYLKTLPCPIEGWESQTWYNRQIFICGKTNNGLVSKGYQNCLPGDSPKLMSLDCHLFADLQEGAAKNVALTYHISKGDCSRPYTSIKMGTAATSRATTIDAIGSCTLSLDKDGAKQFSIVCPQLYRVSSFQRRYLSLHALQRLGFCCCHQVDAHIILTQGSKSYQFEVHTEYETDFVAMRMNHTVGMPVQQISAINLATKGDAFFYLIHFWLGCIGVRAMKEMLKNGALRGIPSNLKIPNVFHCPICLQASAEKTPSNPAQNLIVSTKGAR
jgi:hypothetical protein